MLAAGFDVGFETSFDLVELEKPVAQLIYRFLCNLALVIQFIPEAAGLEPREDVHSLNDHVVVEALLLTNFVEVEIGHLSDPHVVQVTLLHVLLSQEEFKDNQEPNNRVSVELQSLVVVFSTSTGGSESFLK